MGSSFGRRKRSRARGVRAEDIPQFPDGQESSDRKAGSRGPGQVKMKILQLSVGLLAGLLIGATAFTARGDQLRPDRTSDIAEVVDQAAEQNRELAERSVELREENERLSLEQGAPIPSPDPNEQMLKEVAGLTPVMGPAVRVTLTDAPNDVAPAGVEQDLLVVHEQDIQAVVNALFAAGAEAMTIQGQRVISTTAVKCVGSTVVLHGVPYAPPYVITAIGDQSALEAGLEQDRSVRIYRQYAQSYQLGYQQQRVSQTTMPAYQGALPQLASPKR